MEDTLISDLEINKPGDVVSSHNDDRSSGTENDCELRGAVGADSDKSTREEAEEIHRPLEMEKGAENDIEVNGSVATNDVALSQSDRILINQIGTVGTDSNKSPVQEITEMLKLLKVEEGSRENLQVNISYIANDVALSQSDDHLIAVSSCSTLVDGQSSGSLNNFELRGAVGVDSDISLGEQTKQIPMVLEMLESANSFTLSQVSDILINQVGAAGTEADTSIGEVIEETSAGNDYEMEESAEKDLDVNGSGAASSATLSQVNDLLINQVGAVGTESDTSIVEDIEETSGRNDYEMEDSAEDLDVNESGAASSATLSQVNDLLINQVGAVGTESDTSIGEDINETNAGKDFEVNISVAANDVAISHSDAIVINHIGAVGIEFNKTTDAEIKEMPEVLAMEESSGNDLETNISASNNDVALSQSDDLFIAVSSSSTISEDQSSDEGIKQPELLEMEESAEKYSEMNRSCAANNVALFLSKDLLINQIGADEIDSDKSAFEEIKEKPELIEEEESAGNDLEANISVTDNDVASSPSSDLLIAVLSPSTLPDDQSSGEDIKESELLNMDENAGNVIEVSTLSAANDVALFQSSDLINHNGVVGTDFNRSTCEVIKEMPKLPELEEGPVKDPEMNISVADNYVALCQGDDLLITVSSSYTLFKNHSSGEDTENMPLVIEMEESAGNDYEVEESAEKDLEVTGSGATNSATLSQVSDLLINQVGAVGTESDTSIGDYIEETSAGNDYEMEESAGKDLDVNGSGAVSSATLSQVNDHLINQVGAVGVESDTPRGDDIKEMSPGKDYEVKISVAANDVGISRSDDIVINHICAVGIEFNKTTDAEIKEMPKLLAMEESSGKDLQTNILVANNDVALSQSDDLPIAVFSSSTISKDQSSDEYVKKPELLEMEASAGKHPEMNGSSAANNIAIFLSDDLLINQIGADGIDSNKSTIEEIKEKPKLIEVEESFGNDLEANISVADNDVASSTSSDLLIALPSLSTLSDDQSSGEDIKEHGLLNMEDNAGNDLEVNTLRAANDVASFQSTDLMNHNGVVGTDFNKSTCEVIKEMPKLPGLEEGSVKDPETNISVADNDVTLCQGDDLLIVVSSSSTLFKKQSSGEDTEKMPIVIKMEESAGNDYEVEESAEKDLEVTGSGATNSATLSQVSDLLINQVGAVGTESDTSIGDDIEETSAGNDYEMEESAEKDLDVNGSGAASSATLSQVNDLLINQVGAVGADSDTPRGDDIKETSPGKDYEVKISVAANDVAISRSDDIVINHIGAVGIEFNKITDAEIKEMPKLLAMEESSWNDLETNISVANYDVALSQSDDLPIAVFSSSTISKDQSSGEDIKEPELLNMEENAGNDLEVNTLSAANDVALSQSTDLLNHNGVNGTDFNRSTCEVIKEMPKLPELEEGAVKDPETNISVADNDVTLCQGDDLPITVSSSSMLSDNQSPGEDTEKMPIVLKAEDNDGKDLEMHQLEAANNDVLSQSHDVLITTSFPSTVSDQQSSGHGNQTRPELIGAVEIDAHRPESEGAEEMPKLHVTPEPQKSGKNVKFNLRKSLAWDSAFFTSDGVLDADELSTMMEGGVKNAKHQLPGIEEEVYRSMDSISTLESDNLSLECLEAELFEDIRASIQKSNRSSSNLNNSSIKVSSAKKDSPAKVTSSLKKVDIDSGKRPTARMKHSTSSIPQPKIVSRVNSSSTSTLTKRASLSANHAKKDQNFARQPHVIQKGTQAAKTTTQGSKLIVPRRGVPKPLLSSKASPMGSSTALKTELTRPSSSHSNSSSCSSGTDVKSSTTLSRKKTDSKPSKLTTTSVPKTPSRILTKNKPQPPANSRLSSHSVLSAVSSSISPASSISEWSSESSSSTTNNNLRSESRGSIDTGVSYKSLDGDASGQSALSIHPTGRISNQNGNQPISQSGSLARPPSVQPTGLRMPSPKIGFFDGGKSGARTPNGGNIRPQSKLPTGMPKTGATHSNPIISNGVKSGKIPPPKIGASHTFMKPNPQKAAPKPSQEQPKAKSSLVTSDALNIVTDGSRTPFAVKNSETY